ncbi:hypothetical protein [Defluviimonas denitrificans]|nr:hypothetical protein [Defluviimonas denitrificans]
MAQISLKGFRRPSRGEWIAAGATLAATLVYFLVLGALDRRAARYFEELRSSDPATYLVQLREAKGFSAYLPVYGELNGYGDYRPQPPVFLVGRWTMREEALRLTPGQAPEVCSDPVTFDFGLLLTVESGGVALPVQYRLNGETVEMRARNDAVFPIKLVSYGAQLDHIEFTPPGHTAPVLAYLCGR